MPIGWGRAFASRPSPTMLRPGRCSAFLVLILAGGVGCRGGNDAPGKNGSGEPSQTPGATDGMGGGTPSPPGESDPSGGAPPEGTPPPASVRVGLPPAAPRGYLALEGEVVRLAPEQISAQLERVFGWTSRGEGLNGIQYDRIVNHLGVALGGIDYALASERDSFPRIQTVLISRMLAWEVASATVQSQIDPGFTPKLPPFFTKADITRVRPDSDGAEGLAWQAQLEEVYWRMFSRPPTAEESLACRNAFLIMLDRHHNDPQSAWAGLLYALLSTMEFWVL